MVLREGLSFDVDSVLASDPELVGHSKALYKIDEVHYLVKLIPTLSSFTYQRYEDVPGTEVLRLDFYELAAQELDRAGVRSAFRERVGADMYVVERCSNPPFEVIVKNAALGSTTRKYPGLFPEEHRFANPVVKFDFRIDPEDQPIAEDYIREAGYPPGEFKSIALETNRVLRSWLAPRDLLDFCIVIGRDLSGSLTIISEVSPDCMRLRSADGRSLDKDLFRKGADGEYIVAVWSELLESLR